MSETVSIVMPCYKAGAYIGKALESVGKQTHRKWELLAVDDAGPDDGSADAVFQFAKAFPDNRVEWIRHPQNRGVSAARNSAIRQATGGYIALLDPDDHWMPFHLDRALAAFAINPDISASSSQAHLFHDGDPVPFGIECFEDWERSAFPWILGIRNAIPASSVVIKSKTFDQIGLFDEAPDIQHHEDYDLWLRMTKAGQRILLLEEPTVYYRKHAGAATSNSSCMSTAKIALAEKHHAWMFILQREALENLAAKVRSISDREKTNETTMAAYETRIHILEQTLAKIRNNSGIRTIRALGRMFSRS